MEPNYLHIWPRGAFMMIALPNQDRSWTITLFMPFTEFEALDSPARLLKFFTQQFPDSIPLIGKCRLVADYFDTTPSTLLSIKVFQIITMVKSVPVLYSGYPLIESLSICFADILKHLKQMPSRKWNMSKKIKHYSYCSTVHFRRITSIYQPKNAHTISHKILLKHFKTLRLISILSDHHRGAFFLAKVILQYS